MSPLRRGLSFAWEAPQTALGMVMLGAEAARRRIVNIEVEDGRLLIESTGTGISLGHVVFWSRESSHGYSAGSTCPWWACRLFPAQRTPSCFAK